MPTALPILLTFECTQKDAGKQSASVGSCEVEDMIHNFLIIMLEHSMRQKDGWKVKFCLNCLLGYTLALFEQHCFQLLLLASSISFSQDIEATIHCAEWLSIVGGSSTGEQRIRYFFFHVPLHLFFFFFTFLNDLFFLSNL